MATPPLNRAGGGVECETSTLGLHLSFPMQVTTATNLAGKQGEGSGRGGRLSDND